MKGPESPVVPMSEPEIEVNLLRELTEAVKSEGALTVFSIWEARDVLQENGLDVDEKGFVIDLETNERVEPYAFDKDLFREKSLSGDERVWDVFYRPETECDWVIGAKGEIHLSDLHSIWEFDGVVRPVRDDIVNLQNAAIKLYKTFSCVFQWSDALEFAKETEGVTVHDSRRDSDFEPLNLSCLDCEFSKSVSEWDLDYSDYLEDADDNEDVEFVLNSVNLELGDLRCPECSCLWGESELNKCTDCGSVHRWEDMGDSEGGMYWEPYCLDCGADASSLMSKSRYSVDDDW